MTGQTPAENVSQAICRERKAAGLSQKDLAKRIGVSQVTICRWEDGGRTPGINALYDVADALGIDIIDLLTDRPAQSRPMTEQELEQINALAEHLADRIGERQRLVAEVRRLQKQHAALTARIDTVLDKHPIVHRNIAWYDKGRQIHVSEIPVCGHCVPEYSHFTRREDVPEGACELRRTLDSDRPAADQIRMRADETHPTVKEPDDRTQETPSDALR